MHSGSEGVAVAPVTASAAMGSARARAGREAEEGTGSRGGEGRCRGRGEVRGVTRGLGKEAGGGQSGVEEIVTGHCTGERGFQILKEVLGARAKQLRTGLVLTF